MIVKKPLVSIGIPIFNDKLFVEKALTSILSQSYDNIEILLSDDCSNDGSAEICKEFVEKDKRVKYIRQPNNLGISKNMEFLLRNTSGKYFMWAADDDSWDIDFIKILVNLLENHPQCIVAFGPWILVNEQGKQILTFPVANVNYGSRWTFIRLLKLCYYWDDGFGYGLFRRDKILNVKFPIWRGINKKRAYNNIYPTLFFYLTKGNFIRFEGKVLWYNTQKDENNINHKVPYPNNYLKGLYAFFLWKLNVYYKCEEAVCRASSIGGIYALFLVPVFGIRFIIDNFRNLIYFSKRFLKEEMSFF